MKFGIIGTPNKPTIICYFQKSLKSSIMIEIKQQDLALTSFKKIIQRIVNADTKTSLKSSVMVQNLDAYCSKSYYPPQNTSSKMQTQEFNNKYSPCSEKLKNKDSKSAPSYGNAIEPAKKKNKKKKLQEYRRE